MRDYRLTILTWPIPSSWSLENTMNPTENSILERDSPLMCPRFPSPSLYETSVAAAPLCSCQQGRLCVFVCVYAVVEVGLAGRLVWGVLWHLPLWRGRARTLVGHHIYQWLIVTSRPWKHNRDLWPLFSTKAARWSHKPLGAIKTAHTHARTHTHTQLIYI